MAIGKYFVLILPSINIELFIGGLSGLSSQILADHLTLSQPRGEDYAHQMILAPPNFQTFRQPCLSMSSANPMSVKVDKTLLWLPNLSSKKI